MKLHLVAKRGAAEGLAHGSMLYEIGTGASVGKCVVWCAENLNAIENAIPHVRQGMAVPLSLIVYDDPPKLTPDSADIERHLLSAELVSVEFE